MNVAEAFAQVLKAEGCEYLFCFPTTPIMEACSEAGIRPIVTRQERVAGNMADGYSRQTNGQRIGVVSVQQSAGAENAFAGLAHAYTDSSPVLFVPGNWASNVASLPPNFSSVKNYAHVTKWADQIPDAQGLLPRMRRAYTNLKNGRPRPVLLELPINVAQQKIENFHYNTIETYRSQADWSDVKRAVDLLLEAQHPLIWAGQGCLYAQASPQLTELAELVGARVTTSLLGKSAINETHPLAVGTASFSKNAAVVNAIKSADVIFAVGASLSRDFTAAYIPANDKNGERKKIIHSNIEATDINAYFPVDAALIGDAQLVLQQLIDEIKDRKSAKDKADVAKTEQLIAGQKKAWKDAWASQMQSDREPLNFYRVIHDFMQTFSADDLVVSHEPGGTRDMLVPNYEATLPRSYLGWGHSTQLGFSLGACMGAKLAAPEKLVANFMGEGAIGMVMGDLETCIREEIPLMTIINNNSIMGNYQRNIPRSVELYNASRMSGDYAEVGKALGLHTERVEKIQDLIPAYLRAADAAKGGQSALIDIITANQPLIPYNGEYPDDLG